MTPTKKLTNEEAYEAATQELEGRADQMTRIEYEEAVIDRARQLAGIPPLARLGTGQRLNSVELLELMRGIELTTSDILDQVHFGDARLLPPSAATKNKRVLLILFRFTARQDAGHIVKYEFLPSVQPNFLELGKGAGVRLYDALTSEMIAAAFERADERLRVARAKGTQG